MNTPTNTAITQEAQALETLEAAVPAQSMLLVALSQLRPSTRNVRKTGGTAVTELAASIQRVGLLQNLTVIAASDGVHYEVVAGGRRLAALKLLAKKKRIAKDYQVPCLQVADGTARTASLTENVQREAMHPADQFEAFAALIAEGRPVEDIAADFGVTPLVVQRRLKLANVSPRLMADYRADAVNLEQLMALAITDDHAAQDAAYFEAPHWQRSASALRERLTEREIDAQRHPLARFVGLQAYEAAGGGVRRDLFADDNNGVYLTDAALLEQLAQAKLETVAEGVRREGWGWLEVVPNTTAADLQGFQRAPKEARQPNAREAKRIAKVQEKVQAVEEALQEAIDAEDDEKADALHDEGYRLGEQLDDLHAALMTYSQGVREAAGVVVTLDRQGEPVIHRGLLREASAKALRALARAQQGEEPEEGAEAGEAPKASQSEKLTRRLSAHRTAALQVELSRHPQVALAALVHGMVQRVIHDGYGRSLPVGVSLSPQDRLEGLAPDLPQLPAGVALREMQDAWGKRLPEDAGELFAALLAMTQPELVKLLAVCVARTVDGVVGNPTQDTTATLAQAVGLDMGAYWTPTAEGYFKHVSKAVVLAAVQAFAPESVARLAKLKKADMAGEAERLAAGTGWMPGMFRAMLDAETDAGADASNVAEEEAEALTA